MFSKKYISFIFLFTLFIPLIDTIFNITSPFITIKSTENRTLADKPELDVNHLDPFPLKYEDYYNDHFLYRNLFMHWHKKIQTNCFKISPVPDIAFFGEGDWIYFSGFHELSTYKGENQFSNVQIEQFLTELERRKNILEKKNCKMLVYIVPTKLQVYPEFIGKPIRKINSLSNGELLEKYSKERGTVSVKYLLPGLLQAKKSDKRNLYYHTDNHWNAFGAFIGYKEISKDLQLNFPLFKSLTEENLNIIDTIGAPGNIAGMLGIENNIMYPRPIIRLKKNLSNDGAKGNYPLPNDYGIDPHEYETVKEVSDTTLPKLLMIGDSFSGSLMPYLSQHFSRSNLIFDSWKYLFDERIVDGEKPDVVIYVIYEPHLKNLLNNLK